MVTPPHKSLRVLFVDDEKSLQEFMRSELPRLGHEVTVCPDGRAALKVLENYLLRLSVGFRGSQQPLFGAMLRSSAGAGQQPQPSTPTDLRS